VVHKTRNVLDRVPRRHRKRVKRELNRIFLAPDLPAAIGAVGTFLETFGEEFPTACEVLSRDIDDCLTFYRFPQAHWKRIRSTNVIERAFREVKRRTRVVGRFPNEKSALALIWASIARDRLHWHGMRLTHGLILQIDQARQSLAQSPIRVEAARKFLEAA
jgi:putative transposase